MILFEYAVATCQFFFESAYHRFELVTIDKNSFRAVLLGFVRVAFKSIARIWLGLQSDFHIWADPLYGAPTGLRLLNSTSYMVRNRHLLNGVFVHRFVPRVTD